MGTAWCLQELLVLQIFKVPKQTGAPSTRRAAMAFRRGSSDGRPASRWACQEPFLPKARLAGAAEAQGILRSAKQGITASECQVRGLACRVRLLAAE